MDTNGNDALGLYLSIPFCRSKCTYCNFASGVYPASAHERYVGRLIEDLAGAQDWAARMEVALPRRVESVYLGGGTPSLLAPELLVRLFAAMRAEFAFDPNAEITVECAPGQIAEETIAALAAAGVNRVSLGVQSFIDREAAVSGRLHSRAVVLDDIDRLRQQGIENLNVDLIAGLAGQTMESWVESVDALIDADVPHASIYMLEVDEESRLGREMLSGGVRYYAEQVPTDDVIAEMYAVAIDRLGAAGLQQYEISNFSYTGWESQHNLRYWRRRPYLGVGLDASSALVGADAVLRSKTTDDLNQYLEQSHPPETAWLAPAQQHEEAWFLGLRLNAGVNVAEIEQEFGWEMLAPALEVTAQLVDDGLLTFDGVTVRLTTQGQLLSNEVFQQFLGLGKQLDLESNDEARRTNP